MTDHEAIREWLRSLSPARRSELLTRIASNLDAIQRAQANLEPPCGDAALSYAILIEYAQHIGVSPMVVGWSLSESGAATIDALLGLRVDRMLADARTRRAAPARMGGDSETAPRIRRGLSSASRPAGRRGRDSSADNPVLASFGRRYQPDRAG